jgi:hypothetical protein
VSPSISRAWQTDMLSLIKNVIISLTTFRSKLPQFLGKSSITKKSHKLWRMFEFSDIEDAVLRRRKL